MKFIPAYTPWNNSNITIHFYDSSNELLDVYTETLTYQRDILYTTRTDFTGVNKFYETNNLWSGGYGCITGANGQSGEAVINVDIWANGIISYIDYSITNSIGSGGSPSTINPRLTIIGID